MAELRLAVGTYTSRHPFGSLIGRTCRSLLSLGQPRSAGIYLLGFDTETKRFSEPALAARVTHPSWLVGDADRQVLYAVSETNPGRICAFRLHPQEWKLLDSAPSGGAAPCYVALASSARALYTANYASGTVGHFSLAENGAFVGGPFVIQQQGSSIGGRRQESSHPHSVALSPDHAWAYVPDLGADRIFCYRVDARTGLLDETAARAIELPPGSGPRHMVFHERTQSAYVVNELACTVAAFRYHADGRLLSIGAVSTLPVGVRGSSTASDLRIDGAHQRLFVSNRGHDSIASFAIEATGQLRQLQITPTGGRTPRGIGLTADGAHLFVAHQETDDVTAFTVDAETGRLAEAARCRVPTPACIAFV